MSWFKLDDQFPDHPKVLAAGMAGGWLYVLGGCYSARYLTDGRIPKVAVTRLSDMRHVEKVAALLVEHGLWQDDGDCYVMHDYLEYNPSRESVENVRREARERRAKGGKRSADVRANAMKPDPTPPEVLTEPLETAASGDPPKRGCRIPDTFTVDDGMERWAKSQAPDVDWAMETKKFVNYWKAKPGKDAVKLDWGRTWQNWLLSAQGRTNGRGAVRTHL